VIGDVIARVLADLADHPGASATEIGRRLGVDGRMVYLALEVSEQRGRVGRSRTGAKAWRWEIQGGGGG
jgi:DNA-binding MarR family transcriptional regulator